MRRLPRGVYLRGHTFYVDVSIDGKRVRKSGGKTLEEALRVLQDFDSPAPIASSPAPGHRAGPSFHRLSERYLERSRLYSKASSVQSAEQSCKRLKAFFGTRAVSSLRPVDLERFVAARLESVSREAVNRDLRYLKALLRLAVEENQIERLPFKVALLRTTKKLPTILSPAELSTLFQKADDRLRPLLMTAAMAGLRHSELIALDWSDIDFHAQTLSVRAKPEIGFSPKSHAERQVPLNSRLVETLKAHRRRLTHQSSSDPVFQRYVKRGSRWESAALCAAVRTAFQDAELYRIEERPGLHMLRRSFASHVLARQADIQTVRELGGWSGLAVVERYVASTQQLKRRAVERLDFLEEAIQ